METKLKNFEYYAHDGNEVIIKIGEAPKEGYQGIYVITNKKNKGEYVALTAFAVRFTRMVANWHNNIAELKESDFDNVIFNILNPHNMSVWDEEVTFEYYKKWVIENGGNIENIKRIK